MMACVKIIKCLFDAYHTCNQLRLMRSSASAQFRKNLVCSEAKYIMVDNDFVVIYIICKRTQSHHILLKTTICICVHGLNLQQTVNNITAKIISIINKYIQNIVDISLFFENNENII